MPTQTRTWQRKILEKAKRDHFADLYWYIEITSVGRRVFPAAYPGRWIPLIPVGPDPEASRRIAGMVAHFFRLSNPPTFIYAEQLTDTRALRGESCLWYKWTEDVEIDAICSDCGAVERVGHTVVEGAPWLCVECAGSLSTAHQGVDIDTPATVAAASNHPGCMKGEGLYTGAVMILRR